MGDGDATRSAIGGNHLIHAARRNIDVTAIVLNNSIYGMTEGRTLGQRRSTPRSTTTPRGSIDPAFDLVELAKGAGASFVGRSTAFHTKELEQMLAKAIKPPGLFVRGAMSGCPPTMVGGTSRIRRGPHAHVSRSAPSRSVPKRKKPTRH